MFTKKLCVFIFETLGFVKVDREIFKRITVDLSFVDWAIIFGYFAVALIIGLWFTKKAGKDISSFFLGGRNLPWWLVGTSMVATTFAADTPLAVTEIIAKNGIAGNWIWWSALIGGMFTTFFFAKYWRRAGVLTDLEIIEMRYSGPIASFLRGFKSIYIGLFLNALIIAWVNLALMSLLEVFFGIPKDMLIWYVAAGMGIVSIYSSLSGLMGVAVTDVFQFVLAMIGCIILSVLVLNSEEIGGVESLKTQLPESTFSFFPSIGEGGVGTYALSIAGFISFVGIQWWSSWYPGAEPGGGGYIAQRMLSAKDENHAVGATLLFQIAHYCLRPWPWIIVALCSLVLYPNLAPGDEKLGFVMVMKDFLPNGLKGLLLVAFFAAYMSTISTQLNWGASYVVNDFYQKYFKGTDKQLVTASRIATLLLMLIGLGLTTQIQSISGVWEFIMECGAGLGIALILRWFWWRVNAMAELVATVTPFIVYGILYVVKDDLPAEFLDNKGVFFTTVGITVTAFFITVLTTSPTEQSVLQKFYDKIKPLGSWGPFRKEGEEKTSIWPITILWITSVVMAYSVLLGVGSLILHNFKEAIIYGVVAGVCLAIFVPLLKKSKVFD